MLKLRTRISRCLREIVVTEDYFYVREVLVEEEGEDDREEREKKKWAEGKEEGDHKVDDSVGQKCRKVDLFYQEPSESLEPKEVISCLVFPAPVLCCSFGLQPLFHSPFDSLSLSVLLSCLVFSSLCLLFSPSFSPLCFSPLVCCTSLSWLCIS